MFAVLCQTTATWNGQIQVGIIRDGTIVRSVAFWFATTILALQCLAESAGCRVTRTGGRFTRCWQRENCAEIDVVPCQVVELRRINTSNWLFLLAGQQLLKSFIQMPWLNSFIHRLNSLCTLANWIRSRFNGLDLKGKTDATAPKLRNQVMRHVLQSQQEYRNWKLSRKVNLFSSNKNCLSYK